MLHVSFVIAIGVMGRPVTTTFFFVELLAGTDLAICAVLTVCGTGDVGVVSVNATNWTIVMKLVIAAILRTRSQPIFFSWPKSGHDRGSVLFLGPGYAWLAG